MKILFGYMVIIFIINNVKNKTNIISEIALLQKCLNKYANDIPDNNARNDIYQSIPYYISDGEIIDTHCKKSKYFYASIVKLKQEKTYMEQVWENTLQTENTDFNKVYRNKIKLVKENKLAETNFKILHGILPCGSVYHLITTNFHWIKVII